MNVIKKIISRLVWKLRLYRLAHFNKSKTISILTYHGVTEREVNDYCFVTEQDFEYQIKYLSRYFDVLPVDKAFGRNTNSSKPRAIITFDDGFYNNYEHAFPILKKYNVPAVIFLSTAFIDTDRSVWFCYANEMIEKTVKSSIEWYGKIYSLLDEGEKLASNYEIQESIKRKKIEEIYQDLNLLSEKLEVEMQILSNQYRMLDSAAIEDMVDSGLIEFGAHTHNHVILTTACKDSSRDEILTSIEKVKNLTGKDCRYFAYPNGGTTDFSMEHKSMLKDAGIERSFSMIDGLSSIDDDMSAIKRLFVSSNFSHSKFSSVVHGY